MAVHLQVKKLRRTIVGRVILADINFDLHTKEILFIAGPSGVGKTLLLRTLACLDPSEVKITKFAKVEVSLGRNFDVERKNAF